MVSVRDQQPVLSRRERVDEADVPSFVREALDHVRATIERHHVAVQGPPFCIRRPGLNHKVDVEVGWPVKSSPATLRVAICTLPPGLARPNSDLSDAAHDAQDHGAA
jgi:hypothetical protein